MLNLWSKMMIINVRLVLGMVMLHTMVVAASNYLVNFKIMLFGQPLAWSAFLYPLVFVATDLTVRLYGRENARWVIGWAFIPATLLSVLTTIAAGIPFLDALRLAAASGFAYLVASLLDVYVFGWLRDRYQQWWVAPGVSGIAITIVSTYVFFATAFPGSSNAFMSENWLQVATNGIISKLIVNTLIILPAYGILLSWLTKRLDPDAQGG